MILPLLALGALLTGLPALAQPLTAEQAEQVRKVVRQVIKTEPELIIQAAQSYHEKQQNAQDKQRAKAMAGIGDKILKDDGLPVLGNPDGAITMVEFYDYNCGYCKRVFPTIVELIKENKDLRVLLVDFPILRPTSTAAARANLAAALQGKGGVFHTALITDSAPVSDESIAAAARKAGLDLDRLKKDSASQAVSQQLQENTLYASTLQISGTPAFIIGSSFIPGAVDKQSLQQVIDEERKK